MHVYDELYIMNYTCFVLHIVSFATHLPPTIVSSLCDSHTLTRVAFMSMGGRLFTVAWAACQGLFHRRKWPPPSKYKLPVDLQGWVELHESLLCSWWSAEGSRLVEITKAAVSSLMEWLCHVQTTFFLTHSLALYILSAPFPMFPKSWRRQYKCPTRIDHSTITYSQNLHQYGFLH